MSQPERPTPEQMLALARTELQQENPRGKLRIFFGYAAGVGKTYSMLKAAQAQKVAGIDVIVGYVEPHGRPETEALLVGLEVLPRLEVAYRNTKLYEFDLDAALARKPALILVDELAHTNAAGVRHAKRWQDIAELLQSGINVWTTLNVQHIESLNDILAQITNVVVRETIPDNVFLEADDIELVDIPPDELVTRLREGKVYIPAQAARALESFFRKGNLTALRELALRRTAERVHADVQQARESAAAQQTWPTSERLLVCVGPSPSSEKVIRAAKRLADRLFAEWIAVHVNTSRSPLLSATDQQRLLQNLRMAERLGAEAVELTGEDIVQEVLDYANQRNVTKIVIGKTEQTQPRFWRRDTLVDRLLRYSGNIDVYLVRQAASASKQASWTVPHFQRPGVWYGSLGVLVLATAVAWFFNMLGFSDTNLAMVYLLGVILVATRFGPWPSVLASFASVLLFDVLFTEPYYSITVRDGQYLVTFAVMLSVGLLASTLATRLRYQAEVSRRNERRTEALYRLSRQFTGLADARHLVEQAEATVSEVFGAYAVIFLADAEGKIRPIVGHIAGFAASAAEFASAQWVFDRKQPAGLGTDTLPSAQALYLPLVTPNSTVGVLAVQPREPESLQTPETRQLLETFATQIAFALERTRLTAESRRASLEKETERLRSALLSSVSHDLRTPLSVIVGASSSLLTLPDASASPQKRELLQTIHEESNRLSQLVDNLLNMTRLESGVLQVHKDWHALDDVVGSAIRRVSHQLADRSLQLQIPADLPLVPLDPVLIEQVLINLLDNAAKYSPLGTSVFLSAEVDDENLVVQVTDQGIGLQSGEEHRIFEKFYRSPVTRGSQRGSGLGLAICHAIIVAHGGRIWARNQPDRGASFFFSLPLGDEPWLAPEDEHEL